MRFFQPPNTKMVVLFQKFPTRDTYRVTKIRKPLHVVISTGMQRQMIKHCRSRSADFC